MKPYPIGPSDVCQYASGYTLDLYCDHQNDNHRFNEFPWQYTGETFAECARAAKRNGWKLHHKLRTATCPKCTKALTRDKYERLSLEYNARS